LTLLKAKMFIGENN